MRCSCCTERSSAAALPCNGRELAPSRNGCSSSAATSRHCRTRTSLPSSPPRCSAAAGSSRCSPHLAGAIQLRPVSLLRGRDLAGRLRAGAPAVDLHRLALEILVDREELLYLLSQQER